MTPEEWVSGQGIPHPTGGYDEIDTEPPGTGYYLNGNLHRLDGPAYIGDTEVVFDPETGKPLRYEVPESQIDREWFIHGEHHRLDGPAVEHANGKKEWFAHGKRHRADGPAIEHARGGEEWFFEGRRHRLGGHAIFTLEADDFYVHGTEVSKDEHDRIADAVADGAPIEWALAWARGKTS